jgi:hypothetical protein
MDKAALRLRKLRHNRLWCAQRTRQLQSPLALGDSDPKIFDITALAFVHARNLRPCSIRSKDLFDLVWLDAEGNIHCLVTHDSFIMSLDADRIEDDQGIESFQRRPVGLPFANLLLQLRFMDLDPWPPVALFGALPMVSSSA